MRRPAGGDTEAAFDKSMLVAELASMPSQRHRLAFGAAIAERLIDNYRQFAEEVHWGDAVGLRRSLDDVWRVVAGGSVPLLTIRNWQAACRAATPEAEDFATPWVSAALDAVSSVHELLEACFADSAERVSEIGSAARDSVDMHIQFALDLDYQSPIFEKTIHEHPLMQQELKRQKQSIEEIGQSALLPTDVHALRQRAMRHRSFVIS